MRQDGRSLGANSTHPALVVHVTRGTEPLRANFAAKYARGFDAILRVVCVVAWHGRRRIGEGVKFGAEGIHAVRKRTFIKFFFLFLLHSQIDTKSRCTYLLRLTWSRTRRI